MIDIGEDTDISEDIMRLLGDIRDSYKKFAKEYDKSSSEEAVTLVELEKVKQMTYANILKGLEILVLMDDDDEEEEE